MTLGVWLYAWADTAELYTVTAKKTKRGHRFITYNYLSLVSSGNEVLISSILNFLAGILPSSVSPLYFKSWSLIKIYRVLSLAMSFSVRRVVSNSAVVASASRFHVLYVSEMLFCLSRLYRVVKKTKQNNSLTSFISKVCWMGWDTSSLDEIMQ